MNVKKFILVFWPNYTAVAWILGFILCLIIGYGDVISDKAPIWMRIFRVFGSIQFPVLVLSCLAAIVGVINITLWGHNKIDNWLKS
jgi:multisubunit Na+/H+ antiporter MnhE subunit